MNISLTSSERSLYFFSNRYLRPTVSSLTVTSSTASPLWSSFVERASRCVSAGRYLADFWNSLLFQWAVEVNRLSPINLSISNQWNSKATHLPVDTKLTVSSRTNQNKPSPYRTPIVTKKIVKGKSTSSARHQLWGISEAQLFVVHPKFFSTNQTSSVYIE